MLLTSNPLSKNTKNLKMPWSKRLGKWKQAAQQWPWKYVDEANAGVVAVATIIESLQRHLYKTQTKIRYKMWSLIKPPVALKTFGFRCEEPFGGRSLAPADHIVSSSLFRSGNSCPCGAFTIREPEGQDPNPNVAMSHYHTFIQLITTTCNFFGCEGEPRWNIRRISNHVWYYWLL